MTKMIRNTVLMAGLCAMLTGCTTYSPARLPDFEEQPEPETDLPSTTVLAPRAIARLTLVNGCQVEGDVVRITPEAVVFGEVGNYGLEEIMIPVEDIVAVEIRGPTGLAETVAVVGTVVVVSCMVILAVFAIAIQNGDYAAYTGAS